jgi:hypothetical protein
MTHLLSNPAVELQRAGYCLLRPDGQWFGGTMAHMEGSSMEAVSAWVSASGAKVYASEDVARREAKRHGCVVTTVPRNNGHWYEWSEV